MEGYIKLFRKFNQWEWRKNPEMVSIFIYLLLSANHEKGKWQGIEIQKGQLITGRNSLSIQTGLSPQSVRTCIKRLKSTNEITIKSTNKFSIITIVNWEDYQVKSTSKSTNNLTNNQPAINQQSTTNKNVKNDKNNKEDTSKEVVTQQTYGNEDINKVTNFLKEKIGVSLDGSQKDNRQYAYLLLNKLKKDYPDRPPAETLCQLIEVGLRDSFHSKNITGFKYLYYNCQKIVLSFKNNKPIVTKVR